MCQAAVVSVSSTVTCQALEPLVAHLVARVSQAAQHQRPAGHRPLDQLLAHRRTARIPEMSDLRHHIPVSWPTPAVVQSQDINGKSVHTLHLEEGIEGRHHEPERSGEGAAGGGADQGDARQHPVLERGRQRPVAQSHRRPAAADQFARAHAQKVGGAAGDVLGARPRQVRLLPVAVDHQQPAALGGFVHGMRHHFDPRQVPAHADTRVQFGIVIARQIDQPRPGARLLPQGADHPGVAARPVVAPAQALQVEDVAHQIPGIGVVAGQEAQQLLRLRQTRAEVEVGQKNRAVVLTLHRAP
ncbi:MAG: hypothetical protein U5L06_13255 [Rhodovibrio sp.]|nr:hypothetical protein [Rhodovibrio sp.]